MWHSLVERGRNETASDGGGELNLEAMAKKHNIGNTLVHMVTYAAFMKPTYCVL